LSDGEKIHNHTVLCHPTLNEATSRPKSYAPVSIKYNHGMEKKINFSLLTAFLAAMLFGAAAPFGKPLLAFLNDFQMAGLLYLGAALGVSLILMKEKNFQWPWQIRRQDVIKLSGAVLFGGILGPVFLLAGLRIAAAGSVSLWLNMEMVATAVIGYVFFKDHLTRKGWVASLGVLIAASLLAWEGGPAGFRAGGLIALGCLSWGMDNNLTALIDGISPAQVTFWKGLVAGSFNTILGLLIGTWSANSLHVAGALGLGAFSYGLSIFLYITSAQRLGATRAQLVFSSAPFFGLMLSFILGESLTLYQLGAFILFLGSVYLLFRETHSHEHLHQPVIHVHVHEHHDLHHTHDHLGSEEDSFRHSHEHQHRAIKHSHPHLPDLHHRHDH
jgi:drug/metabolite transporter (DMT)-like permease